MSSAELEGFSVWAEWNSGTVKHAPMKPGVYVFRLSRTEQLRRLKGESDILYIGATKKGSRTLRDRLRDHLRLRDDKKDLGCRLERVIKEVAPLEVAWKQFENHADAQDLERKLLAEYTDSHIEFPPLNRQETGKRVTDALRVVSALKPEQLADVLARLQEISSTTKTPEF